jgi:signal transduction histidine kinase
MLNLVANARDACKSSDAKISICTNFIVEDRGSPLGLTPGRYVVVQIRDTGIGMSPEIAERAFEPFYTTKEVGQGSGLGLSQVYGFARQSGGFARILSVPNGGTTIELYLPVTGEAKA